MSQESPFFSIICPNYKTEPFLEEMLRSVQKQTFKNFELILINDGSPGVIIPSNPDFDPSKIQSYWYRPDFENQYLPTKKPPIAQCQSIFQEMVGSDERFRYLSQKNSGAGIARNLGIAKALGQRVVFLDVDDFWPEDYLQKSYQTIIQNPDKIVFAPVKVYQNQKISKLKTTQKWVPSNNSLATLLVFPTLSMNPINYFWSIHELQQKQIQYPDSFAEDTVFLFRNLLNFYQTQTTVQKNDESKNPKIQSKQNNSEIFSDFLEIPTSAYYRQFPNQTSKRENFEDKPFVVFVDFMKQEGSKFWRIGWRYGILSKLFEWRFALYISRKDSKSKIAKFCINILVKFLTLIAIFLAQFRQKK